MALTLRSSFPIASGAAPLLCAAPTGLSTNDLILALVVTADDVTPTPPGGFVLVATIAGTTHTSVYQKIADASEPVEYWFNWTGGNNGSVMMCAVDSSTLTYAVVHQTNTASSESASTSKAWNGVTNTDTNTLLLCFGGFGSNAASTPDGAMTERLDSSNPRMYLMSQAVAASGATGTRTATGSSVATQRCITISITESNTNPITYSPEEWVTELPVIVELGTDGGAYATQMGVLVEIAASGIYLTELPVFAEFGAVGIYLTSLPVLVEIEEYTPEVDMPVTHPRADGTRAMHKMLPEEITGYAFDPEYSWWATVVAEASVNLIINPSFEGWPVIEFAEDGTWDDVDFVEFPPVGATAGRRCARYQQSASAQGEAYYLDGVVVTPGPYTWSLDVYVTRPGATIRLEIRDGVTVLAKKTITLENSGWKRVELSYIELGSGTRKPYLISLATNPTGMYLYTDAWQFEAKKYATTYFDGDSIGFNDVRPYQSYYWQGTPHRSASARFETTGSGGRLVSWSDNIGFLTTSIVGLGMAPVDVELQELADGTEINRGSRSVGRTFTVVGRLFADNHRHLINKENRLVDLMRPNRTLDGEQIVLRYQEVNQKGRLVGPPLDMVCSYLDGLQGNETNFYQQSYALQFRASNPFFREVIDSSAELDVYKLLVANYVMFKDETGDYINLGTGSSNGSPTRVGFMRNGNPMVFGPFTQIAGDTATNAAFWDGDSWVEMGTISAGVNDTDDSFRAGYDSTVALQDGNVAWYDIGIDTWVNLGDGFDGPVLTIDRDAEGNVWAGGFFAQDSLAATTFNNVAKWNYDLEVWEALGTGLTDPGMLGPTPQVKTVLAPDDGYVYFGGDFEQGDSGATTTLANSAIRWNIATELWEAMGNGFDAAPECFALGDDGYIYATGPFTQDGTETYDLRGFARWNGYQWEEVFPLVRNDGTYGAERIRLDENGVFWFCIYYTSDSDLFNVPGLGLVPTFGWKNGVFYPPFSTAAIADMAVGPGDRIIYAARDMNGDANLKAAAHNEIDYPGTADAPLAVYLEGPGHPYQVLNLTTKGGVYFRDTLELGDDEIMTLRSDTQRALAYSNMRPNMNRYTAAGASSIKALRLRPGINYVSVYMPEEDADVKAWCVWKNRYQTISGPTDE